MKAKSTPRYFILFDMDKLTLEEKIKLYGRPKAFAVNQKFIEVCQEYLTFDEISGYHYFEKIPFIIDHLLDEFVDVNTPFYYPIFDIISKEPPKVNLETSQSYYWTISDKQPILNTLCIQLPLL